MLRRGARDQEETWGVGETADDVFRQSYCPTSRTAEIVEREHGKRGSLIADQASLLQPGSDTKGSRGGSGGRQNRFPFRERSSDAAPTSSRESQVLTEAYRTWRSSCCIRRAGVRGKGCRGIAMSDRGFASVLAAALRAPFSALSRSDRHKKSLTYWMNSSPSATASAAFSAR